MTQKTENRRGASGLSYGLVVGLIAIVALTAVTSVGSSNVSLFSTVGDQLGQVVADTGSGTEGATSPTPPPAPVVLASCKDHFDNGSTSSGQYTVNRGSGDETVECIMVPGESGWEITSAFKSMLDSGGYSLHGVEVADANFAETSHGTSASHIYAMFDADHVQQGGTRLNGTYTQLTDRPHPLDAGNNSSFDSINYWNGTAWQDRGWTESFCYTGGATKTTWISCPGTHNPEKTSWAALFSGPGNWGDWRLAFNDFNGDHAFNISQTGDGSDVRVLVWIQ
ncbi:MAG: hypothetical protein Alpg2KO_19030 [Alphaproteobacteria bacterium]